VTFVPAEHAPKVRSALFAAGCGSIGNYDECSFNVPGTGTFRGNDQSDPYVGKRGESHSESEIRIECIFENFKENSVLKLLVIGDEGRFSNEIINYAIDMAKRLSYDILALNTAPLSCDTLNIFSTEQRKVCNDFTKLSKDNVVTFKEKAKENNINFEHVIKFSNIEEAQREILDNYKNIAFVISNDVENRMSNEQRQSLEKRVFVYSIS